MNILHIIGEMSYGGAELLTSQLAIRMTERNYKVAIAVLGFYESDVVSATENAGIEIIRFNARILSLINIWRIIKLVRNGQFDIVHVHLFPALYWGAIARIFCDRNSRWIYTEHSTNNRRRRYVMLNIIEGIIYRAYDIVACVSYETQGELLRWLPKLNNTTVVENGVDLNRFQQAIPISRTSMGLTENDVVILMVGAFRKEKNQAALVRALGLLPKEYKLVLAGDGPELEKVKNLTSTLGLFSRVVFHGAIRDVERLMKAVDVYVLPSLFEGFGLSAVEAAATGLPIVYSDVPGLANIFRDSGIPVDAKNSKSIAEGILKATIHKNEQHDFSKKSIAVAAKFGIEKTVMQYHCIYQYHQLKISLS